MPVSIAIPEPTSSDRAYNQRSLPEYLSALQSSGALAVVVPLHESPDRVARLLRGVQGVLLPGSGHDVDPERYGAVRSSQCAEPDPNRTAVDELLLQDAFNLEKPILGICFGAQTLNVWRGGSLVQHLTTATDHAPGRAFLEAHRVTLQSGTRLARMVPHEESLEEAVNSSHHQAISDPGDNLIVSAKSLNDGVIEAIELDSQSHFVVGIQWHPERTYIQSALSRSIFSAFIHAAQAWKPRQVELSTAR